MKKKTEKQYLKEVYIGLVMCVLLFGAIYSCTSNETNTTKKDNPFQIGKEYSFFGKNYILDCYECDKAWSITFIDEATGSLYSEKRDGSSVLPSCKSKVSYKYDETTNTITILTVTNSNVSSGCRSKFIGEWQYYNGEFGERYYSKNTAGASMFTF